MALFHSQPQPHVIKMLSNNTYLEKKQFNHYIMVCSWLKNIAFFTVEKVLGVHVKRMLEMSRCLYMGGNFKQNVVENSLEIWRPYVHTLK